MALLRMEIASDKLAMSLLIMFEESSALPGGVTSPGRVLPGVLNGMMLFMKLQRFLPGLRADSRLTVLLGRVVLGVAG